MRVDPFWIDIAPVTNAEFGQFVAETGYRTIAEQAPDPRLYEGLDPEFAVPGSLVFKPSDGPVDLTDHAIWWRFQAGADWRHPLGPGSDIYALQEHPVVHIAYADAAAYARWCGKSLPREAEWEFAARGGLEGADYAWGDELAPDGAVLANYWDGAFPFSRRVSSLSERTTPVGSFPPNGFGLSDMIGNVWEWTADWFTQPGGTRKAAKSCCTVVNPRGGREQESFEPGAPIRIGRKVLKGGSHLCAANYCQRYRPAARSPQAIDSSTSHIGFRCVSRTPPRAMVKRGRDHVLEMRLL